MKSFMQAPLWERIAIIVCVIIGMVAIGYSVELLP